MRTLPLAILLTLAAVSAWVAYARFSGQRDGAQAAAESLTAVKRDLAEIDRLKLGGARSAAAALDAAELSRELRAAATAAGLADAPGSEPGSPARLAASDYSETPVYLRFEPLTLRQLVTFLHHLSANDPSARAKRIELSPPQPGQRTPALPADARPEDLWTADIEVDFLTHTPMSK